MAIFRAVVCTNNGPAHVKLICKEEGVEIVDVLTSDQALELSCQLHAAGTRARLHGRPVRKRAENAS